MSLRVVVGEDEPFVRAGGSTTRRNPVALMVAPQASHEDRSGYGERGAVTGGP